MNLCKLLLYPLILASSYTGKIFAQETSYPTECNKINFNAGWRYANRNYINYQDQKDFDSCIPATYSASVNCGMFKNLFIGCEIQNAPSRISTFDSKCGEHMIEKGKRKFQYVREIQEDPCINKYKDDEFYPIGKATGTLQDKAFNRKGKSRNY